MITLKLIKVFLRENFSLSRLIGTNIQKNKKKALLLGLLMLYAFGVYLFSFGYLFFEFAKLLKPTNSLDVLLQFAFMYGFGLSFIVVLFRANGYLFHYKDYELLEPLPIPHRSVIIAKLSVMMILIYATLALIISPIAFSYFYHAGFHLGRFVLLLVGIVMMPLIPLVVFSFLSLLIARITSSFRRSNLVNIIAMFLLFFAIMAGSLSFSASGGAGPLPGQQGFISVFGEYYLPMIWFVTGIHELDLLAMLWLVLSGVTFLFLFVILIQKIVTKTNQKGLSIITRKKGKLAKNQVRTTFMSLLIKEIRKFVSVPIYAVNSGFGPILLIVLSSLSLIFREQILTFMVDTVGGTIPIEVVLLAFVGFSLSTVFTSTFTLSLEGKHFWILKSLPIEPVKIMTAKMAFNILLGLPAAWFSILLFSISFSVPFVKVLVMLFVVLSFSLLTSSFGSFINLNFPKFEFRSDVEVVKQSVGSLIGIFGGFGFMALNGVGFYWLSPHIDWSVSWLLMGIFNLALFWLFYLLVFKTSPRYFLKMKA
jgi:ABC-2 type transport system permease protein